LDKSEICMVRVITKLYEHISSRACMIVAHTPRSFAMIGVSVYVENLNKLSISLKFELHIFAVNINI